MRSAELEGSSPESDRSSSEDEQSPPTGARRSPKRKRIRWRPWLRALHRDFGYIAVGLTVIYALSGLAVNHISSWDSNFVNYERVFQVEAPLPGDETDAASIVMAQAGIDSPPVDVYSPEPGQLEITLDDRTLFVATESGRVYEEGQQPRFFFRAANWLHLNRGKKAWTYFADGYAVVLLFLALSGMFMIPGKKGIAGRGALLVTAGAAIPLLYLTFVGSP